MARQGLGQVKTGQLGVAVAMALAAAGCTPKPVAPSVRVDAAYIQLSPVPGRPASAYFRLKAAQPPERLVSVSSEALGRIELHGSMTMNGMASMAPLTPAKLGFEGANLVFAPGGKHAMVYGVPATIRPGGRVRLTFTFEHAPPVTAQADVRAFGDGAQ